MTHEVESPAGGAEIMEGRPRVHIVDDGSDWLTTRYDLLETRGGRVVMGDPAFMACPLRPSFF